MSKRRRLIKQVRVPKTPKHVGSNPLVPTILKSLRVQR